MKTKVWLAAFVLLAAMALACTGKGDCGRDDGCFGDGDFDGKPNKTPATAKP